MKKGKKRWINSPMKTLIKGIEKVWAWASIVAAGHKGKTELLEEKGLKI
jgi:hypothetical protein